MTTITLPRAVVEQALEALEYLRDTAICSADTDAANEVIPDLEAALAQQAEPVQEPGFWGRVAARQASRIKQLEATAQQALEALEDAKALLNNKDRTTTMWFADEITALRAALAQQAEPVEPVAWMFELARNFNLEGYGGWEKRITEYRPNTPEGSVRNVTPLYTAPPQRKPLTEEEIDALPWNGSPRQFARAVERALEEKNRGR